MRTPTPWIAALLVSVLVNGALFGFLLHRTSDGPSWRGHGEGRPMMAGPPPSQSPMGAGFDMRAFLGALPEAEREQAGRRFHAEMESMRGVWREFAEARAEADAALSAEPFDPEAVRSALARARQIHLRIEDGLETSIIETVAGLDPDVRAAALAAGREASRSGRHGSRWRGHGRRGEGRWRDGPPGEPAGEPGPPPGPDGRQD
jgi:uncharacterized membrane protein